MALKTVLSGRTTSDALGDAWDPIVTSLAAPLDLTVEADVNDRALLFGLADVAIGQDGAGELTKALTAAVGEGLRAAVPPAAALDDTTSGRLVDLIDQVPAAVLATVYDSWTEARTGDLAINPHFCRVELALARQLATQNKARVDVPAETVQSVLRSPFVAEAVSGWLATGPPLADVIHTLNRLNNAAAARGVRQAFGGWAEALSDAERTTAAKALMGLKGSGTLDGLVPELTARGVDRVDLARHLASEMSSANSQVARQRIIHSVELLKLSTYEETRPLAEQASAMLETADSKAAIEDASRLLAAIESTHRMKGAIQARVRVLDERGLLNSASKRALVGSDYQLRKNKRNRLDPRSVIDRITGD